MTRWTYGFWRAAVTAPAAAAAFFFLAMKLPLVWSGSDREHTPRRALVTQRFAPAFQLRRGAHYLRVEHRGVDGLLHFGGRRCGCELRFHASRQIGLALDMKADRDCEGAGDDGEEPGDPDHRDQHEALISLRPLH